MIGDQEQYAVAAALMARQLGFPARVVLGFVVPTGRSTAGDVTLTGADISAWIEVQTKTGGWVTVDPNPPMRPVPHKKPDEPKQVSRPQSIVPPPPAVPNQQQNQPPSPHIADDRKHDLPLWVTVLIVVAQVLGWVVLAGAIVAAPFLTVIAAKWRRRSRRRAAATATERITGGWREFADAALDHGYLPPPSATRSEVAQSVGGMRPRVLAAVADRAVFGPAAPSPADADQVWRAVDELRNALGAGKSRWRRLRAAVSLRSLSGYRESGDRVSHRHDAARSAKESR
jgi:Transglutaminase-like enzymes, putative cysteine proteases